MYQYDFNCAGLMIRWKCFFSLELDSRYRAFQKENTGYPDVQYEILSGHPKRNPKNERRLFETELYQITEDETYRYRIFPYDSHGEKTSVTLVRKKDCAEKYRLYIPKGKEHEFIRAKNWSFYLAFEEMFMSKGRILLHASYVETEKGALLFSGPSGIGKSTQADLWEQCGSGKIINGDRTVLYEREEQIYASGSPYAGSSHIFLPYRSQVRAIIILKQGKENKAVRLKGRACVLPLLEESVFGFQDKKMRYNQAKLILKIAEEIPIYVYTCTRNPHAVKELQRHLFYDRV